MTAYTLTAEAAVFAVTGINTPLAHLLSMVGQRFLKRRNQAASLADHRTNDPTLVRRVIRED